jgi:hypothetical protein
MPEPMRTVVSKQWISTDTLTSQGYNFRDYGKGGSMIMEELIPVSLLKGLTMAQAECDRNQSKIYTRLHPGAQKTGYNKCHQTESESLVLSHKTNQDAPESSQLYYSLSTANKQEIFCLEKAISSKFSRRRSRSTLGRVYD